MWNPSEYPPTVSSNLTRQQWQQIVNTTTYYIRDERIRLTNNNFGDREWDALSEYESTLNDILLYVIPHHNK